MRKYLKALFCRHKKYTPRTETERTKHKIFCSNCGKLLKVVHPEDSPAKIVTHPEDYEYEDEFLTW